jgi:hypothetical protein
MRFKRMPLPASVSRRLRGERDGNPPMRPDDDVRADVGGWESTGDVVAAHPVREPDKTGTA